MFFTFYRNVLSYTTRFGTVLRKFIIALNVSDGFCWYFPILINTYRVLYYQNFDEIRLILITHLTTILRGNVLRLSSIKNVDQKGVMKMIELLLISLILGIFYILYVNIKSGKYQQNPSSTFWAMKNFAKQGIESYHILLYIMLILGVCITFRKTSIVQKVVNRSIWYFNFEILSSWNITYLKNKRFQRKLFELLDPKHVRLKSGHTVYSRRLKISGIVGLLRRYLYLNVRKQ